MRNKSDITLRTIFQQIMYAFRTTDACSQRWHTPVEPVMFTQNFVRITVTRSFQFGTTKFGSVVRHGQFSLWQRLNQGQEGAREGSSPPLPSYLRLHQGGPAHISMTANNTESIRCDITQTFEHGAPFLSPVIRNLFPQEGVIQEVILQLQLRISPTYTARCKESK